MPELKQISLIHVTVVALITLPFLALRSSPQQVPSRVQVSLLGGALIGTVNITYRYRLVDEADNADIKSIALAGFVIVIKYAAFIAILMALYTYGWRPNFGFVMGLSSVLPTVAWAAYRFLKQGELNGTF